MHRIPYMEVTFNMEIYIYVIYRSYIYVIYRAPNINAYYCMYLIDELRMHVQIELPLPDDLSHWSKHNVKAFPVCLLPCACVCVCVCVYWWVPACVHVCVCSYGHMCFYTCFWIISVGGLTTLVRLLSCSL